MPEWVLDIGNKVLCDMCAEDYSHSNAVGGFLFESKAVCPKCAPRVANLIIEYNEQKYIVDMAREGETFLDFVLRIRAGDNTIRVTGPDDDIEWARKHFMEQFGNV